MATVDRVPNGAFCWFELATSDQQAAKRFYQSLFGWDSVDSPIGPSELYTVSKDPGRDVAAAYTIRKEQQGMPPNWMPYVQVASADAAAAKVAPASSSVEMVPFDVM